MQRNTPIDNTHSPDQDDALAVYKDFLTYAGEEANLGVEYNRGGIYSGLYSIFSEKESSPKIERKGPELKIHSTQGNPAPISAVLSHSLYCNKLIIRNIQQAKFLFNFADDVIPRIVGIDQITRKPSEQLMVTYRNIVPSQFAQTKTLAGPMAYHEYVIDGKDYTGESMLTFTINPDSDLTPLRIVLENCKGNCMVMGLDEAAVAEKFSNKCAELEFAPMYTFKKLSY